LCIRNYFILFSGLKALGMRSKLRLSFRKSKANLLVCVGSSRWERRHPACIERFSAPSAEGAIKVAGGKRLSRATPGSLSIQHLRPEGAVEAQRTRLQSTTNGSKPKLASACKSVLFQCRSAPFPSSLFCQTTLCDLTNRWMSMPSCINLVASTQSRDKFDLRKIIL